MKHLFWLISLLLIGQATVAQKYKSKKKVPFQGICGNVLWKAGNLMPSPDAPSPQAKGIARTLFVYQLSNQNQATVTEDNFYKDLKTKLVAKVKSDKFGKFCVNLPKGWYSVFSQEPKGLYANGFDGEMNIFPVEVKAKTQTNVNFEISYMATF